MHDNRLPITVFAPAIYLDLQRFMLLSLLFIFSLVSRACFTFLSLSFKVITMLSFQYAQTHVCPIKPVGLPPSVCVCVCVALGKKVDGNNIKLEVVTSECLHGFGQTTNEQQQQQEHAGSWKLWKAWDISSVLIAIEGRGAGEIYLLLCLLCRNFSLARFACDEDGGGTRLLRADIRFNGNCNYSKRNFS